VSLVRFLEAPHQAQKPFHFVKGFFVLERDEKSSLFEVANKTKKPSASEDFCICRSGLPKELAKPNPGGTTSSRINLSRLVKGFFVL